MGIAGKARQQQDHVRENQPTDKPSGQKQRHSRKQKSEGVFGLTFGQPRNKVREDLIQPDRTGQHNSDGDRYLKLQVESFGDGRVNQLGVALLRNFFNRDADRIDHHIGNEEPANTQKQYR